MTVARRKSARGNGQRLGGLRDCCRGESHSRGVGVGLRVAGEDDEGCAGSWHRYLTSVRTLIARNGLDEFLSRKAAVRLEASTERLRE